MLLLSNFIKITLLTMTLLALTGCGSKSTTDTNTTTQSAEGNVTVEGTDDNQSLESNTTTPPENNETRPEHNTSTPQDSIAPTLTLNGEPGITLDQNAPYAELGATALDAVDGNVSVSISGNVDTAIVGSYTVTYSATDVAGNEANITRSITIIDVTPPIITLNGESNVTLTEGDVYEELGATATDAEDANVSVSISGDVNTSTVGVYVITYTATDSSGNSASVTRTVHVENNADKIKTLTLTASQTHYIRTKDTEIHNYSPIVAPLKVIALYEGGQSEEVTDSVVWHSPNVDMIPYSANQIKLPKGDFSITATLDGITSNAVDIKVEDDDRLPKFLRVEVENNSKKRYPNRDAFIQVALVHKPTEDVNVRLRLKESDGVRFKYGTALSKELIFSPSKYRHYVPENLYVMKHELRIVDHDTNNTNPYTITVEPLESLDPFYDANDPTDIVVKKEKFSIIEPPLRQRRGAIRGVTIVFELISKESGLEYTLIDPPKGMKIIGYARTGMGETMFGKEVEWKVPMDIEEKTYNITAKATDVEGNTQTITFPIKVPKTKPIQTKLVNNELIVTDKSSNLYGMKMKGHSGEDISELRLRSVAYRDVWKHDGKAQDSSKKIGHIVFIVDNMPKITDIKFPAYMDTFEKRINHGAGFDYYIGNLIFDSSFWGWNHGSSYLYDNTNGVSFLNKYKSKINSSEVFIFTINEKL